MTVIATKEQPEHLEALEEREHLHKKITNAMIFGEPTEECGKQIVMHHESNYFDIKKHDGMQDTRIRIYDDTFPPKGLSGTYVEVEYNTFRGIDSITYMKHHLKHRMMKPARMAFFTQGVNLQYFLNNDEYNKEDFDKLMDSPLGKLLAGSSQKEVLAMMKVTENVGTHDKAEETKTR